MSSEFENAAWSNYIMFCFSLIISCPDEEDHVDTELKPAILLFLLYNRVLSSVDLTWISHVNNRDYMLWISQ